MATTIATVMTNVQPLPKRLLDFFARYPPKLYSAKFTGITIPLTRAEAKMAAQARASEVTNIPESSTSPPDNATSESSTQSESETPLPTSRKDRLPPNPFMPFRNPATGRWRGATIGLRRQAELVKIARIHGVEPLLPPSRKSTAFKEQRILQRGLRVKGTGEGQKVKGHKWERTLGATIEKRRAAMEAMPELIREWKQKGHGRGWKKYPK